jgi:hypothetical protein
VGYQIIQQPNEKWAVFSSVSDTIVRINASEQGVIDWFAKAAKDESVERTTKTINDIKAGGKPYHQFTKTWKEALAIHMRTQGKVAFD